MSFNDPIEHISHETFLLFTSIDVVKPRMCKNIAWNVGVINYLRDLLNHKRQLHLVNNKD